MKKKPTLRDLTEEDFAALSGFVDALRALRDGKEESGECPFDVFNKRHLHIAEPFFSGVFLPHETEGDLQLEGEEIGKLYRIVSNGVGLRHILVCECKVKDIQFLMEGYDLHTSLFVMN